MVEDVAERKKRERLEEEQEDALKVLVAKFRNEKTVQPAGRMDVTTPTSPVYSSMPGDRAVAENDCENDNACVTRTENDNENDNEHVNPGQATIMNNGPSNVPLVTLGQSNGSPHTPLVYTKGGCEGADEHPWLKVVHGGVDESDGGLVGEGGMDMIDEEDLRMTPKLIIIYETDEDEFLDAKDQNSAVATCGQALISTTAPCEKKNTAQRDLVAQRKRRGVRSSYDLAYFKLWWARMEIEGRKQAKQTKDQSEQGEGGLRPKGVGGRRVRTAGRRGGSVKEVAQDQPYTSQFQESVRVGDHLRVGEIELLGVGRGSPVSEDFHAIIEQPRASESRENIDKK